MEPFSIHCRFRTLLSLNAKILPLWMGNGSMTSNQTEPLDKKYRNRNNKNEKFEIQLFIVSVSQMSRYVLKTNSV